jgi:hypothetical protein
MPFSDLALSKRLERAEGHACVQYAEAQHRLFPKSGAAWIECAGAYAVFNGVDSPITQSFGLGLFEELTAASLDVIERFFLDRGAPVHHEVSPFAGVTALDLLCKRNYRPIELSNVLYRPVEQPATEPQVDVCVRVTGPEEAQLWTDISARGWAHAHPELREVVLQLGTIIWRVHASWLRLTVNPAPRACCQYMTTLLCLVARRRFQSCGVAACKQRSFTRECAMPSSMDAIWQ